MIQQTIQFTIMPRGLTLNPATLPVSVLVSPRLSGADNLGSFPDWLSWTQQPQERGPQAGAALRRKDLTVSDRHDTAAARAVAARCSTKRPTCARYTFPDYTKRAIFSYPVRLALSAMKSMYQQARRAAGSA